MIVSPLSPILPETGAAPQATPADSALRSGADFQSFLALLTAQLRNQDPLQPIESTQFVAQLASFSTVEQLIGVNRRLDGLAEQAGGDQAGLATWIGRFAGAVDGRFRATGAPVAFEVPAVAGAIGIRAEVLAPDGAPVDSFDLPSAARTSGVWDGVVMAAVPSGTELRIELVYAGPDGAIDRRPAPVLREIVGLRGTGEGPVFDLADGGSLRPAEIASLRSTGDGPVL